jgi:hypothetical protein
MLGNITNKLLLPFVLQKSLDTDDRHELNKIINEALDNTYYWCPAENVEFWTEHLAKYYQERTGYVFVRHETSESHITAPF